MDGDVARTLDDAFPEREVERVEETGPSWNPSTTPRYVEFADGTAAYLKLGSDDERARVDRERAVLQYLDDREAVPTPGVVACDTEAPQPHLATAPLSGTHLVPAWYEYDDGEEERAARAFGTTLARVHADTFDRHGTVVGGGADGLALDEGPWTDVLIESLERTRALATADRFPDAFDDVIAAVEANRSLLDGAPAALLHGDPAKPNCVRTDDGMGLVDWENAHVGDPVREVYRARDQALDRLRTPAPDRIVDAFHDGYRSVAGGLPAGYERRRPVYEATRFLGVVGFFDAVLEYREESAAELAAWAEGELERLLAAIRRR
jgi:aminoglycoside phosphotransferase (APT) family kinase protein